MLAISLALPYVAMAVSRERSAVQAEIERKRGHVNLVPAHASV
jgi:hypothetical protein